MQEATARPDLATVVLAVLKYSSAPRCDLGPLATPPARPEPWVGVFGGGFWGRTIQAAGGGGEGVAVFGIDASLRGIGASLFWIDASLEGIDASLEGSHASQFGIEASFFLIEASVFTIRASFFRIAASHFAIRASLFGIAGGRVWRRVSAA